MCMLNMSGVVAEDKSRGYSLPKYLTLLHQPVYTPPPPPRSGEFRRSYPILKIASTFP